MSDSQSSGNAGLNADALQQALRAFGAGGPPPASADLAALVQRMGLPNAPAQPAPAESAGPQYIFILLGGIDMAWPAAKVVGVEKVSAITPVPNTAEWVLGVANLRGAITSVVDLRYFLGLPREAATSRSRIVVASASGMIIGFNVDAVNEIRVVPPEGMTYDGTRQAGPPWLSPYVDALAQIGGRRALVIDLERLLFADALHHYRAD